MVCAVPATVPNMAQPHPQHHGYDYDCPQHHADDGKETDELFKLGDFAAECRLGCENDCMDYMHAEPSSG